MPRFRPRFAPGLLLHVVNRGQAHAPLFESQQDVDRFLSLLAWAVREAWIRVLAYCVLSTHFHLLIETRDGRPGTAMGRIEAEFARWRNRTRERSGHVFKGRYFARAVGDPVDLASVVSYIDWNPVKARIVPQPHLYAHASARAYVEGGGPTWLARDTVEDLVCHLIGSTRFRGQDYARLWAWTQALGTQDLIERTSGERATAMGEIAVLSQAGPEHVQAWLRRHLMAEEGRAAPCLALPGEEILRRLEPHPGQDAIVLRMGLLHQLAGWTTVEIAKALGVSQATVSRRIGEHRRRMQGDPGYTQRAARLVSSAARELYGPLVPRPAALGEAPLRE